MPKPRFVSSGGGGYGARGRGSTEWGGRTPDLVTRKDIKKQTLSDKKNPKEKRK